MNLTYSLTIYLAFYLPFYLAFCLTYILTVYLALYPGMLSDIFLANILATTTTRGILGESLQQVFLTISKDVCSNGEIPSHLRLSIRTLAAAPAFVSSKKVTFRFLSFRRSSTWAKSIRWQWCQFRTSDWVVWYPLVN